MHVRTHTRVLGSTAKRGKRHIIFQMLSAALYVHAYTVMLGEGGYYLLITVNNNNDYY